MRTSDVLKSLDQIYNEIDSDRNRHGHQIALYIAILKTKIEVEGIEKD